MLQVKQEFHSNGFMSEVDLDPGCTLNKKIRNAQLAQYNFILGQCNTLSLTPLSLYLLSSSARCPSRYWFFFLSLCMLGKVVGEKEKTSNTVNVRTRDNKVHGERTVEECIERLQQLKTCKSRNAEEDFWSSHTHISSLSQQHRELLTLKEPCGTAITCCLVSASYIFYRLFTVSLWFRYHIRYLVFLGINISVHNPSD